MSARPSNLRDAERAPWIQVAALAALAIVLYARGFALGFVGDDFTLLDAALRRPLSELLLGQHGILGYYRPVSRELYFWWWGKVLGLGPAGFHAVNALTYAGIVAMLYAVARRWLGSRGALLAALVFVVFPPGGALLSWVSCAQDLIALFWGVAAILLYIVGRRGWSGVAVALAMLSKETAVVIPAALAFLEWRAPDASLARAKSATTAGDHARRLLPVVLGAAAAVAIAIAARVTWPPGTAVAIWSPVQLGGAWRLPLHLAQTLLPPGTAEGLANAWRDGPVWILLVAALALVAVPASIGAGRARAHRTALIFGLVLAGLAMLPVGFIVERWRGYFFSFSALGLSLAAAVGLRRVGVWPARAVLAALAVVNLGFNGTYRPVEARWGPARHPHVNYAFFRDNGALTQQALDALEPWCDSLRSSPRVFVAGVPPEALFQSVFGPARRVTCRDTADRVRFLAEMTAEDARADFAVLRVDPRGAGFRLEKADARVRSRIGEGFLLYGQYDLAAACLEAAANQRIDDPSLSYPLATTLAAAGRGEEAKSHWLAAVVQRRVWSADTLAARLLAASSRAGARPPAGAGRGGAQSERAEPRPVSPVDRAEVVRLAAATLRNPAMAEPHRVLGRKLLDLGRARSATLELAVASGISRVRSDLVALGEGYEAMGATDRAREAYRVALAGGLEPKLYEKARARFFALGGATAAPAPRVPGTLDPPLTGP